MTSCNSVADRSSRDRLDRLLSSRRRILSTRFLKIREEEAASDADSVVGIGGGVDGAARISVLQRTSFLAGSIDSAEEDDGSAGERTEDGELVMRFLLGELLSPARPVTRVLVMLMVLDRERLGWKVKLPTVVDVRG